jgi:hypothetical protein
VFYGYLPRRDRAEEYAVGRIGEQISSPH